MFERISGIDDWWGAIDVLERGGMVDRRKYPWIQKACRIAKRHNDFGRLESILRRDPWILERAVLNIRDYPFCDPRSDEIEKISGRIRLGIVNEFGDYCGFMPADFCRGLFVSGEIGSGKSYPVLWMLDQILSVPKETRGFNIIVIQMVKRDADFLIRRHKDLRIIEWEDLRHNPLDTDDIDLATQVFCATNYLVIRSQAVMNEAINVCKSKGVPICFGSLLENLKAAVKRLGNEGYDSRNVVDKVQDRLREFNRTGVVMNCLKSFSFEKVWAKEDVIINLVDQPNTYFGASFVSDLLVKLMRFHGKTGPAPHGLKTLVVIDECRSVFPILKDAFDVSPDRFFEQFVTTRRSSGIGLIAVTQEPGSVNPWLPGNSSFYLAFPIAGENLEHVKKLGNLDDDQLNFMLRLPKYGTAIFRDRRFDRPYLVCVPGVLKVEHISVDETQAIMKPYIDGLHAELEKGVHANEVVDLRNDIVASNVKAGASKILSFLKVDPFITYTKLRDETGLGALFDRCVKWLEAKRIVVVKRFFVKLKSKAQFLCLTDAGHDLLGVYGRRRVSLGHYGHSFYKWRVAKWLKGEGWKVSVEFALARNGAKVHMDKRIDVFAAKDGLGVAYEIQLSLKREDVLFNVEKCFFLFGADRVVVVCEKQKPGCEKAKEIVEAGLKRKDLVEKVDYLPITKIP